MVWTCLIDRPFLFHQELSIFFRKIEIERIANFQGDAVSLLESLARDNCMSVEDAAEILEEVLYRVYRRAGLAP